jgi:alpha-ketoglutarate-dependent taurine dioxygenase
MVIRPLQGQFAAELIGLRLPVDDAAFAAVEAAWTRHPLLVFRDLKMTPEQHIAFTRRFGDLHIMEPLQYNLHRRRLTGAPSHGAQPPSPNLVQGAKGAPVP